MLHRLFFRYFASVLINFFFTQPAGNMNENFVFRRDEDIQVENEEAAVNANQSYPENTADQQQPSEITADQQQPSEITADQQPSSEMIADQKPSELNPNKEKLRKSIQPVSHGLENFRLLRMVSKVSVFVVYQKKVIFNDLENSQVRILLF